MPQSRLAAFLWEGITSVVIFPFKIVRGRQVLIGLKTVSVRKEKKTSDDSSYRRLPPSLNTHLIIKCHHHYPQYDNY